MGNEVKQIKLGKLADSLGFLLRLSQIEAFDRYFANNDMSEMRLGDLSMLHMINLNPGIRQGVLARMMRVKRAQMTKTIHGLVTRKFVRTTVPPRDRRSVELWLTGLGTDWLEQNWVTVDRRETLVASGLSPQETYALKKLLRKFVDVAENTPLTDGSSK